MESGLASAVERVGENLEFQSVDLDVHLNRRDALPRSGNLEVHVTQMVFTAEDIREDDNLVSLFDQPHRHTGARSLQRNTCVHQGQRAAAHTCHGR